MSPLGAIRGLGSPVREETVKLTLPPRELPRPMVSPAGQVSRVPQIPHFLKTKPPSQATEVKDPMLGRILREASEVSSPSMDSAQDPDSKGVNAEIRQILTSDSGRALHIVDPGFGEVPGDLDDSPKEAEFKGLGTTEEIGSEQPATGTPKEGSHDSSIKTKDSSTEVDSFAGQLRTSRPKSAPARQ